MIMKSSFKWIFVWIMAVALLFSLGCAQIKRQIPTDPQQQIQLAEEFAPTVENMAYNGAKRGVQKLPPAAVPVVYEAAKTFGSFLDGKTELPIEEVWPLYLEVTRKSGIDQYTDLVNPIVHGALVTATDYAEQKANQWSMNLQTKNKAALILVRAALRGVERATKPVEVKLDWKLNNQLTCKSGKCPLQQPKVVCKNGRCYRPY